MFKTMKYLKFFILFLLIFAFVELLLWIHTTNFGWCIEELLPGDAISLWGTVMTIVFLVFSVLALWNIDNKIHELTVIRQNISDKFTSIEEKHRSVTLEAEKAQAEIIKKAEEQIKLILDKSSYRQNFADTLTRVANIPDPGRQVLEYTSFLRTSSEVEGINYAYVYVCRGDAYLRLSRFDKALADYQMAAKLDKETVAPYFALGNYYVTIKDYKKSVEIYKEGLEKYPQNENLMMNIANSYSVMGDFAKADQYYDRALTYNPDLAMAYYNKSKLVMQKKGPLWKEQSLNYLNHCIAIMPYFYQANINKAALLRDEGKNGEAQEVLSKVIGTTFRKDFIMSVLQRGIIYRQEGKLPMALNDFNTVLLYNPNNIQNITNLALTYFTMGFAREALFYAELGKAEGQKQNMHDCDEELMFVIKQSNNLGNNQNFTVQH